MVTVKSWFSGYEKMKRMWVKIERSKRMVQQQNVGVQFRSFEIISVTAWTRGWEAQSRGRSDELEKQELGHKGVKEIINTVDTNKSDPQMFQKGQSVV